MADPVCRVDIACNGDGGVFLGEAECFEFQHEGDVVRLDAANEIPVAFEQDAVRIGGELYRITGRVRFVGNWCWDEVGVTLEDARRLFVQLLAGSFSPFESDNGNPFADLIAAYDAERERARG